MEQIDDEKIRELFNMFDSDGGGTIDVAELTHAFINLGISDTKEEIDDLVRKIDTDGSGEIELEEFRDVMLSLAAQKDSAAEMHKAFLFFSGGKERITVADLRKVMVEVGDQKTDQFLHEMFLIGDVDKDGSLTFQDFKCMMEAAIASEREGLTGPKVVFDAANERDGVVL